jgi:hypothetical protein
MNRSFATMLLLLTVATACKEKPKTEPLPAPAAPAEVQKAPTPGDVKANVGSDSANLEAAALDSIPVQEDYEERARVAITAENLDAEIESLERETAE